MIYICVYIYIYIHLIYIYIYRNDWNYNVQHGYKVELPGLQNIWSACTGNNKCRSLCVLAISKTITIIGCQTICKLLSPTTVASCKLQNCNYLAGGAS